MTGKEAIEYLDSYYLNVTKPDLNRIITLMNALGNPQKGLRCVHVAGTNGKGSTCAMVERMLREAGYRSGLFTSPHLIRYNERMQICGVPISDEELGEIVSELKPVAESTGLTFCEFEMTTAVGLMWFARKNCDIVVLEVGLGGALDASNVIDCPEVAVLTAMGMDHAALLGPTLSDVAAAKAGIVKKGGMVVSYGGCPEADRVFRRVCAEQGAHLREADFSRLEHVSLTLEGANFDLAPYRALSIPLAGAYQVRNAAVAVTALETLRENGWAISEEAIRRGLAAVRWPARFEVLRQEPLFLLDGAHNAHGMRAAVESLLVLLPEKKLTLVLGILADKDVEEMLELLSPLAARVFVIRPESPRALPAESLCAMLKERGIEAVSCDTVKQAVAAAAAAEGKNGAVCALGSLYLSGAVKEAVKDL